MTLKYADRVLETSSTTGTGTLYLTGATAGFQTFIDGVGDGAKVAYFIEDGQHWEAGVGTVTAGAPDTLSRDDVKASSTGGSLINWEDGTRNVFIASSAHFTLWLDENGELNNENIIGNHNLTDMPAQTLKGNAAGLSSSPVDLTKEEVISMLGLEDIIGGAVALGSIHMFTTATLPDGYIPADGTEVDNLYPELKQLYVDAGYPYGTSGGGNPLRPLVQRPFYKTFTQTNASTAAMTALMPAVTVQPLNTSGTEIFSQAVPDRAGRSAYCKVRVQATGAFTGGGGSSYVIFALFKDGTFVKSFATAHTGNTWAMPFTIDHEETLASGASPVFSVRVGATAGTIYLNCANNTPANKAGGGISTFTFTETEQADFTFPFSPGIKAFGSVNIAGMADLGELLTAVADVPEAITGASNTKFITPYNLKGTLDGEGYLKSVPFYSGSDAGNLNFPIGSFVGCITSVGTEPARNSIADVCISTSTNFYYTLVPGATKGTPLAGVWRSRGNIYGNLACIVQRVA